MDKKSLLVNSALLITSSVVGMGLGEIGLQLLGYAGTPEVTIVNIRMVDDLC